MSTTREIEQTELAIARLRREFEKYFSGANDLPPHELETKVLAQISRLRTGVRNASDQFRVNSLEARFSSYRELYRRRLREAEEGRNRRAAKARPTEAPDPRSGVRIEGEITEQAALSLYRGLYGHEDAPAVGLPQFRRYLEQQVSRIRQRTGCDGIVFRLAEDNGKQRLKAKPLR